MFLFKTTPSREPDNYIIVTLDLCELTPFSWNGSNFLGKHHRALLMRVYPSLRKL